MWRARKPFRQEQRRRTGCRRGQGQQSRKHTKQKTNGSVENLAGDFHAEDPAIFTFFAGWWWLAMRGADQVVRSGLPHAEGFSIRRASDWSHGAAGLVSLA
jgi:hypothetical protein